MDSRAAAKAHVGFLAGMNSLDGSGYEDASNLGVEIGLLLQEVNPIRCWPLLPLSIGFNH